MNRPFSLYLDLARFGAAVLVVLTHYVQHGLFGAHAAVPIFGREAVMLFFVLSGYVIAYTTTEQGLTLKQYAIARSARIYSVVIPIVLLCFVLVAVVAGVAELSRAVTYQLDKPYLYLPLHFLFMGELWNLAETPPWLIQYWSLGYEVWYYVLFGVVFYLRGAKRLLLGALVLLVMGFKLWLLLPVWLAGVALYRYQKDLALSVTQARLGWLATILAMCAYKYAGLDLVLRAVGIELWPFPALRLGNADRYLADYVICILVCLNFAFARQCDFSGLQAISAPIRALASHTFTLYLLHGPLVALWALFYPYRAGSAQDLLLLSAFIALATWLVGFITEQRRDWYKDAFNALLVLCSRRVA